MARSGWLSRRGGPRMRFEEFPDNVGRVQIVAWLADPFFRQSALSARPHVAEPFDRVVNDLGPFRALLVCDLIDTVARASGGDLRTASKHPFPLSQRMGDRRRVLRGAPRHLRVTAGKRIQG